MEHGPSPRALALIALAGLGLCVAASSLSAANGRPPEVFLPIGVSGAVFVTSGYLVARQRPANRIGYLLMLIGATPPTFGALRYLLPVTEVVNHSAPGVISALLLSFVLLAFPSGKLTGTTQRVALSAMTIFFALYVAATILTLEPPLHGLSRCPPCVANPFRVTDLSVYPVVDVAGDIGIVTSALVVGALSVSRWYRARGAARRLMAPVLFGGIATAIGYVATSLATLSGVELALTGQILLIVQLLVPIGLAVTFLRAYAARGAVAGAVVQLGASPSSEGLEAALRRAVGDPGLMVTRWSQVAGAYLDREGQRVALDELDVRRSATRLERDGQPLAAVVHDATLEVDPALVRTIADSVRFAVDTTDLRDRLRATGGDASALPRGEVTFLFGDLEGSTEMLVALGDAYSQVLSEVRRLIRESADRFEGTVVDARADECFLAFPAASGAVEAAVDILRRLREATWPPGGTPRLRVGLHLGTPELTADGYVGLDVHRAARVMSAANGDQVMTSASVATAVKGRLPEGLSLLELGWFSLKGIPEPEFLYQVIGPGLSSGAPPRATAA
jgi:class 3 adenylate cyclase